VLFFRQVLADLYPKNAPPHHDVLFSDGDSPGRDVQFADPRGRPRGQPPARPLARRGGRPGFATARTRCPACRGAATRANLEQWFAKTGPTLREGDRLILYVTGHGSRDEDAPNKADFTGNTIDLWDGGAIDVAELSALLDRLPAGVTVVAVMVQCYSGGFAELMFAGGQSAEGPAKAVRCGFFAAMPDRVAAGCTPDVDEAGYEDYSSSFWAALRGRTRTGAAVERAACDFDRDGTVTFAEAHAHVLLTDDSIDVPTTTSDRYLRLHSDPGAAGGRLVGAGDMLARVAGVAGPAERAVIDGLSKQLGLHGQYRYAAAGELAESLFAKHKAGEQAQAAIRERYDAARQALRDLLEQRWPELASRWHPAVDRLLGEEGPAIVAAAKAHRQYAEFERLHAELGKRAADGDALEAKWAKCQRLLRTLERVALAHNLPHVADEPTLERYKALLAAESGTLGGK
jgi:hypothetical protein